MTFCYKATNKEGKTLHGGFTLKAGEAYYHDGPLVLGREGFHFCEEPIDVLRSHQISDIALWVVLPIGKVIKGKGVCVCDAFVAVRALSEEETKKRLTGLLSVYTLEDKPVAGSSVNRPKILYSCDYVDGLRHGRFHGYDDDEHIDTMGRYERDQRVGTFQGFRKGLLVWTGCYENGLLSYEMNKRNQDSPTLTLYDEKGQATVRQTFDRDMVRVHEARWNRSMHLIGNPFLVSTSFRGNVKHGAESEFHWNDNRAYERTYKDGVLHGTIFVYNEEGILCRSDDYVEGRMTGFSRTFYDDVCNNVLKAECAVLDGKRHGPFKEFRDDGSLRTSGDYVKGKREGTFFRHRRNGEIKSEAFYRNDIRVHKPVDAGETHSEEPFF